MKFDVRKTDFDEYDVRLALSTKQKIKRNLWISYWTVIGVVGITSFAIIHKYSEKPSSSP